ncbi:uncharacterized protein B0H18DRAFT_978884 [Fomitopsis serialis]|uniref:uncharacterized protein n=1 Tax=Fomitopsis serialis TaxID=139415 RepID=UPI002008C707|nr:uncharacterized protein B0H18DRAFT_978884 [Neoantrodia serialis]KAH9934904.1 hypothetical protein B0H18DRAFT_978884 [Neoantrodia serialis]
MRSHTKLYVHPDLKPEEGDVTLVTTICLVLSLALAGAIFIVALSCLLWDDCQSSYGLVLAHRARYLSAQQLLIT